MLNILRRILFDEKGDTLTVTYSFSPNALIVSNEVNVNFDDVEAVVNALTATNYANDSVGKAALGSDVVRANYGLIQHTDGSLYVDVSDTNPCLEISDGGLRVKVDGSTITRTAAGLVAASISDHGSLSGLTDDDHAAYLNTTRHDADDHSGLPSTPTANKAIRLDASAKLPRAALKTYDSGWFAVANGNAYSKTHNLGTTKVLFALYFSTDSGGASPVSALPLQAYSGVDKGIGLGGLTTTVVVVQTGEDQTAYYPYNSDGNLAGEEQNSGYCRLVMIALG